MYDFLVKVELERPAPKADWNKWVMVVEEQWRYVLNAKYPGYVFEDRYTPESEFHRFAMEVKFPSVDRVLDRIDGALRITDFKARYEITRIPPKEEKNKWKTVIVNYLKRAPIPELLECVENYANKDNWIRDKKQIEDWSALDTKKFWHIDLKVGNRVASRAATLFLSYDRYPELVAYLKSIDSDVGEAPASWTMKMLGVPFPDLEEKQDFDVYRKRFTALGTVKRYIYDRGRTMFGQKQV